MESVVDSIIKQVVDFVLKGLNKEKEILVNPEFLLEFGKAVLEVQLKDERLSEDSRLKLQDRVLRMQEALGA